MSNDVDPSHSPPATSQQRVFVRVKDGVQTPHLFLGGLIPFVRHLQDKCGFGCGDGVITKKGSRSRCLFSNEEKVLAESPRQATPTTPEVTIESKTEAVAKDSTPGVSKKAQKKQDKKALKKGLKKGISPNADATTLPAKPPNEKLKHVKCAFQAYLKECSVNIPSDSSSGTTTTSAQTSESKSLPLLWVPDIRGSAAYLSFHSVDEAAEGRTRLLERYREFEQIERQLEQAESLPQAVGKEEERDSQKKPNTTKSTTQLPFAIHFTEYVPPKSTDETPGVNLPTAAYKKRDAPFLPRGLLLEEDCIDVDMEQTLANWCDARKWDESKMT
jgi:hypothetical protein